MRDLLSLCYNSVYTQQTENRSILVLPLEHVQAFAFPAVLFFLVVLDCLATIFERFVFFKYFKCYTFSNATFKLKYTSNVT